MFDTDDAPSRNSERAALSAAGEQGLPGGRSDTHGVIYPSPVEALLTPQTLPRPTTPSAEIDRNFVGLQRSALESFRQSRNLLDAINLPQKEDRWFSRLDLILFAIFAALPIFLGTLYFGFIATGQYVSEFRFNVIDSSMSQPVVAGGLASLMGGAGLGAGVSDSYTVVDFLTSPQAVTEVEKKLPLRQIYSPENADWFSRFNPDASREKLDRYWDWMVWSYYDPATNIASARVRAFSAEEAHKVATTLLAAAEQLVNDIQNRQRTDSIKFAQEALNKDNKELADLRRQMLDLRKETGYIDPTSSGVAENIQLTINLRTAIVSSQADLDAMVNQTKNPNSATALALKEKIKSMEQQLAIIEQEIRAHKGSSGPLSEIVGRFDDLTARQATQTSIIQADMVALQQARVTADAQHLYLVTYVHPTYPTTPMYPQRFLAISLVVLASIGAFCFAKLISAAMLSHAS